MASSWDRYQDRVRIKVAATWGERLSADRVQDMTDMATLATLYLWVGLTWAVCTVVAGIASELGPLFVVVWLVGLLCTGVIVRKRIRAINRLYRGTRSELGLAPTMPIDFRNGLAAFDESVRRGRDEAAARRDQPLAITTGSAWERRIATLWGSRLDGPTVHQHKLRMIWFLVCVAVVIASLAGLLLVPATYRAAVLVVGVTLLVIGVLAYRRHASLYQAALAHHLGLSESQAARVVLRRGLAAFDRSVEAARARVPTDVG